MLRDDQKWPIPERFRCSLDPEDPDAYALLQKNDLAQKELAKKAANPLSSQTPQERTRSKALGTIAALHRAAGNAPLTEGQRNQLADAFGHVGRFDLAAEMTTDPVQKASYEACWSSVFKPDLSWCEHGPHHRYLKQRIFSLKHGAECSLMACNIDSCGFLNVIP